MNERIQQLYSKTRLMMFALRKLIKFCMFNYGIIQSILMMQSSRKPSHKKILILEKVIWLDFGIKINRIF